MRLMDEIEYLRREVVRLKAENLRHHEIHVKLMEVAEERSEGLFGELLVARADIDRLRRDIETPAPDVEEAILKKHSVRCSLPQAGGERFCTQLMHALQDATKARGES